MHRRAPARRQRGLSIVEMLVGVAIGLFVVAASTLVVSTQLSENRRLLVETQMQQDLRATADIVTRELRRSGSWEQAFKGVWYPGTTSVLLNPRQALAPISAPATEVTYGYHRAGNTDGPYQFALDNNTIKADLGGGSGLQDLTDKRTLKVTTFSITPTTAPTVPTKIPCPKLCPDTTQNCWPTVSVRELTVLIEGEAANDPSVKRSVQTTVRVRNDWVSQLCPT